MTNHPPSAPLFEREERLAIGIDVGGTKIAGGIVSFPSGKLSHRWQVPTRPERGGQPVLNDVVALAEELLRIAESECRHIEKIGLGVCELVDAQSNTTSQFTLMWKGVPVQERLSKIVPACVEADVRAHARAEAILGAGRAYREFVFVTLGTGISSCWVQDGAPYPGARGNALVLASSPLTIVGDDGSTISQVLEDFASGPAIARRFGAQRAEEVFNAAERGDARALQILTTAGDAVGNSIAFLTNVLDPEAIVIGGGLGMAGGILWDRLVVSTHEHIWSEDTRGLPIITAELGNDAGVIGAAASALHISKAPTTIT